MKMVEWRKLLASVREQRWCGQIHLMQRDARGICGRKVVAHRLTTDINLITCLDCQTRRLQPMSINEILRNKGRLVKNPVLS